MRPIRRSDVCRRFRAATQALTHTHAYAHRTGIQEQEHKGKNKAGGMNVLHFGAMNAVELRQWVTANPGRVNDTSPVSSRPSDRWLGRLVT